MLQELAILALPMALILLVMLVFLYRLSIAVANLGEQVANLARLVKPKRETLLTPPPLCAVPMPGEVLGSETEIDGELRTPTSANTPVAARISSREEASSLPFGELLVKEKIASAEEVGRCLSLQARMRDEGHDVPLGEIMVSEGVLAPQRIANILRRQGEIQVRCLHCAKSFPIDQVYGEGKMACPSCGGKVLIVPDVELHRAESWLELGIKGRVPGDLTAEPRMAAMVSGFRHHLSERLVVNLENCSFLSPDNVVWLKALAGAMKEEGGWLAVMASKPQVMQVLRDNQADKHLCLCNSFEALRSAMPQPKEQAKGA